MKKIAAGCVLLVVLAFAGVWFLLASLNVQSQVEGQAEGSTAYVFGEVLEVHDSLTLRLVVGGNPYLVHDGTNEVWVVTNSPLPRQGRHVLVEGAVRKALTIPGRFGGGSLVVALDEGERWDFPL